jgi:hypothetical protein
VGTSGKCKAVPEGSANRLRRVACRAGALDRRWLPALAVAVAACSALGAVVAISSGMDAQFGGAGDPHRVAQEALGRGTALSAPLLPVLVCLACGALSLARARWWGTLGLVGMALGALLFTVGGLAEAWSGARFDLAAHLVGALGTLLSLTLLALAMGALAGSRRTPLLAPAHTTKENR